MNQLKSLFNIEILLFLLVLNTSLSGFALNKSYQFDNFDTKNGLNNQYITSLFQDQKGWLWIGTGLGINRFDGITFKQYLIQDSLEGVIGEVLVRNFFESNAGDLYVCIEEKGIVKYNRNLDQFERIFFKNKPIMNDFSVKRLAEDKDGNLWAATKRGLQKIDFSKEEITIFKHTSAFTNSVSDNYVRNVIIDRDNNIWIGSKSGLDKFNPETEEFTHYSLLYPQLKDDILELIIDDQNRIWIGMESNGVAILEGDKLTKIDQLNNYDRSTKVNTILQENHNTFWFGTRGGLFKYDEKSNSIQSLKNNPLDSKSIIHNSIIDLIIDNNNDLWIGTRGGLSHLIKQKQFFENFVSRGTDEYSLNNDEIYAIFQDENKELWFGTELGGINILNPKSGKFRYITKENSALRSNCIKSITAIDENRILIGTFEGGLYQYNKVTNNIEPILHHSDYDRSVIWDIHVDSHKNIWIGSSIGLDKYNPNNSSFEHYPQFDNLNNGITWINSDSQNKLWFGGGNKLFIFQPENSTVKIFDEKTHNVYFDSSGNNWVLTTDKGITKYDIDKGIVQIVDKNAGLSSNLTYCMLEDKSQKLWISTAKGINCYNPADSTIQSFYYSDGLHGNEFHYGSEWQTENGNMYFGGINGITYFNPDQLVATQRNYPIYFTDFKIFNQSVEISQSPDAILNQSISVTNEIKVPYKSNMLTIEFAALNYVNSDQQKYNYKLNGFDLNWNETEPGIHNVTYTNLNPGEYLFEVKSIDADISTQNAVAQLNIIVVPPYYMTTWFKLTLALFILIILILLFIVSLKIKEKRKAEEFEIVKAKKLHELDAFKLKLFSNISHEIKTPLTLIVSPLRKILKSDKLDNSIKSDLKLMQKNTEELSSLVTQLLDYRKLQEGKLELELKQGDLIRFCDNIFERFQSLMQEKSIKGNFVATQQKLMCLFDDGKLRQILNNLISNAIRYNKKNGEIIFTLTIKLIDQKPFIQFEVKDTGLGIAESDLPKIFERYYSNSNSDEYASTGIGLAYTKELVKLHNGFFNVQSQKGEGSTFTIQIPFIEQVKPMQKQLITTKQSTLEYVQTREYQESNIDKKVILLIEDNTDMNQFIKSSLNENYTVLTTFNGAEGWEIALHALPDIIISDIMMPGLNGIELTQKVKQDERTSHIPIILLTALDSNKNIKEGLNAGADEYLTKPFDVEILKSKIENLFQLQKTLVEKYKRDFEYLPQIKTKKSPDEKFLEKLLHLIEDNIDNSNLNINTFMEEMNISRMQLYRKTSALTGMTVKELVNDIRLKKAVLLLVNESYSITEVAYQVGFNDISYFGKCFKKKYGTSPSNYIEENK